MNIAELNEQIAVASEDKGLPIGLIYGKMGLSIYFYRLARQEKNDEYNKLAGRLLDEIFEHIGTVKSIDVEHGLSGIGLGISYLIRHEYVQGNENSILRDVDDEIFKKVCSENVTIDSTNLIHALLYICVRKQSLRGEQEFLFRELAVQIINTLHARVEKVLNDDVLVFSLNSELPLFLFALGNAYEVGIFNYKIERIILEITPFLLSKYSYRDAQKLQLLWGIGKIKAHIHDERLTEYCHMLASQIDFDNLLGEFRSKNMFLHSGLAGVCLLMLTLDKECAQMLDRNAFYSKAKEKIENSIVWESPYEFLSSQIGLSGYCGLITIYNAIVERV